MSKFGLYAVEEGRVETINDYNGKTVAKIERLYEVSDYEIFPKEIVEVCQKMIKAEYL